MKPKILFVVDTLKWAWAIKTRYVRKYLSDEFDIDILATIEKKLDTKDTRTKKVNINSYDLCFTYGYAFIDQLKEIPKSKKITGVTAHRPRKIIEPKMKKACAVHANSHMLYKQLCKIHNKVYYLPNGVNEKLFKPLPIDPNKELVVGHVGKLSPRKGQKEIIEPATKKAKVPYFSHYNKYHNSKPHKKMPEIYKNFDVQLCASIEDGTPNPCLEAASCGRPIISNKIGNMPQFIRNGYNGFLVEREIDAYVEKILWFKNNRDKLIEMGKNARKTIEEEWTWKIQAENYRKMFRDLLNEK